MEPEVDLLRVRPLNISVEDWVIERFSRRKTKTKVNTLANQRA